MHRISWLSWKQGKKQTWHQKNSKRRQGRNNQEKILFATILSVTYSKSSSDVCVVTRGVGTRCPHFIVKEKPNLGQLSIFCRMF